MQSLEDRSTSKLEWTRKYGGMVRGPYGRRAAQEVAGAEGQAEGLGFWFCKHWGVGVCSDGCVFGGSPWQPGLWTALGCRGRLTGYCNSPGKEG